MEQTLLEYERTLAGHLFWVTLAVVAVWEGIAPRRALSAPLRLRWFNNLAIWGVGTLVTRWTFPILGVAFALLVAQRGWGLFHLIPLPSWLVILLSLVALDLARYIEHWLYHRIPVLWRLHRLHHADLDCDVTAGLRFHPLEAIITAGTTLGVVAALGAPPVAVLVDQALMGASIIFAHGNIRLAGRWEALLRLVVVTPEMHRVHHSAVVRETDSNLSVVYSWWDRLFGTYVTQPGHGHEKMTIGLDRFRERKHLTLPWLLIQPFLPDRAPQLGLHASESFSSRRALTR